jgi:hypothetical protein
MSEFTINFNDLKFNLYEILNISSDSSEQKIKKAFRNLIMNFHPDKNSDLEEDIYQHIISANQILLNKELRIKYDEFISNKVGDHDELKKSFNKEFTNITETLHAKEKNNHTTKEEATKNFHTLMNNLTKKNINDFNEGDTLKNYEQILKDRDNIINIPKEEILDTNDFNNKFENKILNKGFGDQIISMDDNLNLSTYNSNDNYTNLDVAFDNLYINDKDISTAKFTSIDTAFKIQTLTTNKPILNIKDAMSKYNEETSNFTNPNFKFINEQYNQW